MNNTFENINLILLNVGYSELNANWNWKDVYSPFARIYYVNDGVARTYINGQKYVLEPGYLYLTPPFTLHNDECDDLFSLYYIHFYENVIRKESVFDKYDFPVKIKIDPHDEDLIKCLWANNPNRHLEHIDPKVYDNNINFSQFVANNNKLPLYITIENQGILSILLSRFLKYGMKKSTNRDARIVKSLEYIHSNINNEINIKELADLSYISKDHFIRLFKKELGMTPIQYINSKKIEKAQLLLITSDQPVREIALDLAIDNISYFNKIFKRFTGKTPLEYRSHYD